MIQAHPFIEGAYCKMTRSVLNTPDMRTKGEQMGKEFHLTQPKAKVLIRDYLREEGRKGVTDLLKEINVCNGRIQTIAKRTLEAWLKNHSRSLNSTSWSYVKKFVLSSKFREAVPYYADPDEARLLKVADGLLAFYERWKPDSGYYLQVEQLPTLYYENSILVTRKIDDLFGFLAFDLSPKLVPFLG